MYWLLLAIISALFLPFANPSVLELLALTYFIFALVPVQQLAGVKFRSQHIMSRNYLLSLPIPRKTNFIYLGLRMQIFNLPLLGLFFLLPTFKFIDKLLPAQFWATNWHLFLLVPICGIWLSAQQLHSFLTWEEISSHLTSGQRFRAWVVTIFSYIVEFSFIVWMLVFSIVADRYSFHLPVGVALSLAVAVGGTRLYFTQKKWIRT